MPVYKSKEVTKDGRKWFFKCQYKDVYGETHTKKSKKSNEPSLFSIQVDGFTIYIGKNNIQNDYIRSKIASPKGKLAL